MLPSQLDRVLIKSYIERNWRGLYWKPPAHEGLMLARDDCKLESSAHTLREFESGLQLQKR